MPTERPKPKSRFRRSLAVLIATAQLFALLLFGMPLNVANATEPVRLGTTTLEAPTAVAPSDAPRLAETSLHRPAPPISFNRHDAGWIHFAYPPEVRERIQPLINMADAARQELSERLGRAVLQDVSVRIARTPGEMATLAPEGAPYPKYASGVAYSEIGLILLTLEPPQARERLELMETFKHELAHVALHDATRGQFVPRWFNEGFAVFASGESSLPRLQTLWTATLGGSLLPLSELERSFPANATDVSIAYAEAADVVRYLARGQDRYRFSSLVERLSTGVPFERAMMDSFGIDRNTLEFEWREDVARRYSFWPVLTSAGVLWIGIIGLFFWGYHRRRVRSQTILARWGREEAAEDALRAAAQAAALRETERVHIVLSHPTTRLAPTTRPMMPTDPEIPTVEHDGGIHTLH